MPGLSALDARARLGGEDFAGEVVATARDLIGGALVVGGVGGVIVETEAYHVDEEACHAYRGPTPRAARLFGPPGVAYVYLSYGIHRLFNIVTGPEGDAAAVLIRALEPRWGIEAMSGRRRVVGRRELCSGPGKLTEALAIDLEDNGRELQSGRIEVYGRAPDDPPPRILRGPRVGITRAVELPWRFVMAPGEWASPPRIRG